MPRVVPYADVVAQTQAQGLVSLYHNSGAFGFGPGAAVQHLGWVGPPDATIRAAAQALARHVPPPYEPNLATLVVRAWAELLSGPAWVLPKSHWAFELDFGSPAWMPAALREAGVEPDLLVGRNDGSAMEFQPEERERLACFVQRLLRDLAGSDFALLFPGRPVIATLHHHKQVWWSSSDPKLFENLKRLVIPEEPSSR